MQFPRRAMMFHVKKNSSGSLDENTSNFSHTFIEYRSNTISSSRARSEDDLTAREYQLFWLRSHLHDSRPIQDDDRQLGHKHNMFLIPLDMAAHVDVIKYRMEGFEMREHREHIRRIVKEEC
ncbi:hypothetical protein QCA50_000290 [Cerrena zonata]|uniref:Uncharacterized protein n=1 Tax=Cerrena zonata TaxID=2478898 RepID=A0AAW0GUI8_9APHY